MEVFRDSAMNVLRKKGIVMNSATRDPRTGHRSPAKALAEMYCAYSHLSNPLLKG